MASVVNPQTTEQLEGPELAQRPVGPGPLSDPQDFIKRNQKKVTYIGGAILGVLAIVLGWFWYSSEQNKEAQAEMFHATFYFESDSLKKALNGDGNHLGMLSIADDYGMTKAGELAHFYAGAIYLKQGKYQEAIDHLEDFSSSDILVQGRAYCLLGDAHAELNQMDEAAKYYRKAADYKPNKFFTPGYLMKLALVQENQKDYKGASETYGKIIKDYYETAEATEARKYKARAEAMGS